VRVRVRVQSGSGWLHPSCESKHRGGTLQDFEPLGVIPIHEFVCSVKRTAANKVSIVLPERTYILRSSDKRHLDAVRTIDRSIIRA